MKKYLITLASWALVSLLEFVDGYPGRRGPLRDSPQGGHGH